MEKRTDSCCLSSVSKDSFDQSPGILMPDRQFAKTAISVDVIQFRCNEEHHSPRSRLEAYKMFSIRDLKELLAFSWMEEGHLKIWTWRFFPLISKLRRYVEVLQNCVTEINDVWSKIGISSLQIFQYLLTIWLMNQWFNHHYQYSRTDYLIRQLVEKIILQWSECVD